MTSRARTALFLVTGAVWAFRSLQSFTDPNFYDPESVNDWVAVLAYTAALLLLAAAVLALPVDGWRRWLLRWTAVAAVLAGVANGVEDGLGQEWGEILYIVGASAMPVGLVAVTVASLLAPPRWPAAVTAVTLVGMFQLELGGGLLVLAAWVFAALMFRRSPAEAQPPEPESS